MRIKAVNVCGEILLIRQVSESEKIYLKKLSKTSKGYNALLALVINRKLTVNSFTGKLNKLNETIKQIREILK